MRTLKSVGFAIATALLLTAASTASAQLPHYEGVYHDPDPGTFEFIAVEKLPSGLYLGWYYIDGVEYLGNYRDLGNGQIVMEWLHTGPFTTAGTVSAKLNRPKGNYVGQVLFYDEGGNVTSQGRVDLRKK